MVVPAPRLDEELWKPRPAWLSRETPVQARAPGRLMVKFRVPAQDSASPGAGADGSHQSQQSQTDSWGYVVPQRLRDDAELCALAVGGRVAHHSRLVPGLAIIDLPEGTEDLSRTLLQGVPGVEYVSHDGLGQTNYEPPNDPRLPEMTWRSRVCIDRVWEQGITDASDIVVAVIDSGVNYLHPDLAPNMWVNPKESRGLPGVDDDNNGVTDDLHGAAFYRTDPGNPPTYVPAGPLQLGGCDPPQSSSTPCCNYACWNAGAVDLCESGSNPASERVMGISNDPFDHEAILGVSCQCPVDPSVAASFDDGHGTKSAAVLGARGDNALLATGVAWRANIMAVRPVDIAYGCYRNSDFIRALEYASDPQQGVKVVSVSLTYAYSQALEEAVAALGERDIVLVCCAQNSGVDLDDENVTLERRFPAAFSWMPHVLTVSGVVNPRDTPAFNWGRFSVDVHAPAQNLPALGQMYGATSGATPIVAGIVALYRVTYPSLTPGKVVKDVVETARDVPALQDLSVSEGVLDAAALFGLPACNP